MNWIEAYRTSVGMNREEFARAVTEQHGGGGELRATVPAELIYMLERWPKCYTHPRLINAIAHACGATKAQRDMFLHPRRRAYPFKHSSAGLKKPEIHKNPWRELPGATTDAARQSAMPFKRKPVVILDQSGCEVMRAASCTEAAELTGYTFHAVANRCKRLVRQELAEGANYTFRFAADWDALSPAAQALEMRDALRCGREGALDYTARPVVVVAKDGRVLTRYEDVYEAAEGEKVTKQTIYNRCFRRIRREFTKDKDSTFRFAEEWDAMTPDERMKDLGAAM